MPKGRGSVCLESLSSDLLRHMLVVEWRGGSGSVCGIVPTDWFNVDLYGLMSRFFWLFAALITLCSMISILLGSWLRHGAYLA